LFATAERSAKLSQTGGSRFVSISHAGIANAALLASAHIGEINEELAAFLDVSRVLCRAEDVVEIRDSPRYALHSACRRCNF
jgi:hypothetical protein